MPTSPELRSNCLLPLVRAGKGWVRAALADRLESALKQLCATPRGSLPWAPDYGTLLYQYRTQGMSEDDADSIMADLSLAVARWKPGVQLIGVKVLPPLRKDKRAQIRINWGVPAAGPRMQGGNYAIKPRDTTVLI